MAPFNQASKAVNETKMKTPEALLKTPQQHGDEQVLQARIQRVDQHGWSNPKIEHLNFRLQRIYLFCVLFYLRNDSFLVSLFFLSLKLVSAIF